VLLQFGLVLTVFAIETLFACAASLLVKTKQLFIPFIGVLESKSDCTEQTITKGVAQDCTIIATSLTPFFFALIPQSQLKVFPIKATAQLTY
jgi:hypothetical protein